MKIKTPVLVRNGFDYYDKKKNFRLCGAETMLNLGVDPNEVFRLIISTKKLENGFKGEILNADDSIFFKSKNHSNQSFHLETEDWIMRKIPKLRKEGKSIKVWVEVDSYGIAK